MEARRTFQGDAKSSRIYIVVAALLAAIVLGLGGGYAAKGLGSASAPAKAPVVVQPVWRTAPDDISNAPSAPATQAPRHAHQTVF